MIDQIIQWDIYLFEVINHWNEPVLNQIMPFLRHKLFWIPLYLFIVSFVLFNFQKKGIWLIMFMVITIAISDHVSSQLLKKSVQRLRPCRTETIKREVKLLIHCGGGYSFPSSHATNHMALSLFIIWTLGKVVRKFRWLLLLWALLIGFGQIYVGVHFPVDVLFGFLLGGVIAFFMQRLFWYFQPQFGELQVLVDSME